VYVGVKKWVFKGSAVKQGRRGREKGLRKIEFYICIIKGDKCRMFQIKKR
jgi:hypothetical protein